MPTKLTISTKTVDFPKPSEAWAEKEAFREYYNAKQAAEYKLRKERYKSEVTKASEAEYSF